MAYNQKDFYFKKAKAENFAARSIYKLQEIDQRFRLLKPGNKILDLGAAPGSWSQYASKVVGLKGRVLGIDLQVIKITLQNAVFVQADMLRDDLPQILEREGIPPPFDSVLSDMAPKTTGIRITDQSRSVELCEMALTVAVKYLKPGGSFVCKLFHSGEFEAFRTLVRAQFEKVEVLRPKSTRQESKEIFFIAQNFKGAK